MGCLVDPELVREKLLYSGAPQLTDSSPDTSFYQWVPLVLVIQAGIFYIPRRIWKSCEGGLMMALSEMIARRTLKPRYFC